MDAVPLQQKDIYKTSRLMYLLEAAFEYFISVACTGTYLAKLTTSIGISDSMTAILTSITSLAGVFQLFSIFLAHRTPVKRWVIPMQIVTNLMFAFLYMIPLMNFDSSAALVFFITILAARALGSVAAPAKSNWYISLIDDRKRGQFQALLNIVSMAGYVGFTFLLSQIIDSFEQAENLRGAFITLTIIILALTVLHTLTLIFSKEKETVIDKKESPLKSVKTLLANKKYTRVLILYVLWSLAANFTSPFLGTYQINELGFSMTFIAIIDIVMTVIHIPVIYYFGRYSMRRSYSSIMRLSYFFALAAHIILALSTRSNGMFIYTLYRLVTLLTSSAQAVSSTNLIFDIVPHSERTSAIAINTIVVGIVGFLTTLAASPLVDYVQANGNVIFGVNIFAQQILAIISALLIVVLIIYYFVGCKRVLES